MSNLSNNATKFVSTASDIIFIGHPLRTSLGVFVGIAFGALIKGFSPLLVTLSNIFDFSRITDWEYAILGIVIMHIKTLQFYFFKKGSLLSEDEEKAIAIIKQADKEGVPETRIHSMWILLCEKILAKTELKPTTKEAIAAQQSDIKTN